MTAKRRIHKFNFDEPFMGSGAKTHVALVDKAANLTEALVLKAETYTTNTLEVQSFDDDGSSSFLKNEVRVTDFGGDEVRVTNEQVLITSQYVKVI
jgi:SepF-like predicted cell division protein (DUF552 family)